MARYVSDCKNVYKRYGKPSNTLSTVYGLQDYDSAEEARKYCILDKDFWVNKKGYKHIGSCDMAPNDFVGGTVGYVSDGRDFYETDQYGQNGPHSDYRTATYACGKGETIGQIFAGLGYKNIDGRKSMPTTNMPTNNMHTNIITEGYSAAPKKRNAFLIILLILVVAAIVGVVMYYKRPIKMECGMG